ncbi:MAG: D-glycero-beta-D-manno-heptose-7-phosphate kinase [Chloroflexi bacterium]|nr:D-glycero-beta-D-manno-heptose-7-phosphate kinase [Chloroflexota bacterium]
MLRRRLRELLGRFDHQRLLIVGDVMVDQYVWGTVTRISPEAPVPVVEVDRLTYLAGGAANVALNATALGAWVSLIGVVGADAEGRALLDLLAERGMPTGGLLTIADRPTTFKTRVIGQTQQIVRIDREVRMPVPADVRDRLLAAAATELAHVDGVILSDYSKGVVTAELAAALIALAHAAGLPIVVDPKGRDFARYAGATVVKPNRQEAAEALGSELTGNPSIVAAGQRLLTTLATDAILITRGADGMSLFEPGRPGYHLPTSCTRVVDPTGAGDTVTAVYALALAAGATHREAALLASHAAAIVCQQRGAVAVDAPELRAAVDGSPLGRARDNGHLADEREAPTTSPEV